LKARPEPTQLEHLSDASFLGKLLVFPANVRLDWKVIACYKQSSLFGLIDSDEGKKFCNTATRWQFPDIFCGFYVVNNHEIAKNSTTTKSREKMSTDLECLEF
jgi:hypothetical protein